MTMNEFTEERQEEAIIGIGPISQPKVGENKGLDGGGGGGGSAENEKPKQPIAVAITEPEETGSDATGTEPAETEDAETTGTTGATEAPADETSAPTEGPVGLQIWHDHDRNPETPIAQAGDTIDLGKVEKDQTYQLEAVGEGNNSVKWFSSDEKIASVNDMGLVTFTGEEGEVIITLFPKEDATHSDSVTISTRAETLVDTTEIMTAEEEAGPGLLEGKGLLLAIIGGLLVLAALAALLARSLSQKKKNEKRPRPQMHLDQDGEHTAVQSGPVRTDLTVPAEDAVSAVQPMNGIRAGVYQALGARKDQQDSYGMTDPALYAQQGVLALVADGMGGLANGKAVSSALVNTFLGEYRNLVDREQPQDILVKLSISANQRINQMLMGADRSGSTLVSVMIREGLLYFLTVGDSRIYLYRGGALLQLNREHIYQEELVVKAANCQVPLSQVTGDRQAHALTSFFGSGSITYLDRNYEGIRLVPGDRLMLCSDGVFGTLSQAQMERAMEYDVRTAAETLKNMVLDAGKPHQDNNTCVILEYLG